MWLWTYVFRLDLPQRICLCFIWLHFIISDWFFLHMSVKCLTHFHASLFLHFVMCLHLQCFNFRLFLHVFTMFTRKHCSLLSILTIRMKWTPWYICIHVFLIRIHSIVQKQWLGCFYSFFISNITSLVFLSFPVFWCWLINHAVSVQCTQFDVQAKGWLSGLSLIGAIWKYYWIRIHSMGVSEIISEAIFQNW